MTAEEAIKFIEIAKAEAEWECLLKYVLAFETAIEALEKQMPKKPVSRQRFADLWLGFCPSCTANGVNSEMCNCDKCGQAIDWSEEE